MYFTSQSICLVILLTLLSLNIAIADMTLSAQHEKWMTQYGRVYKDAEEKARRFEIFKDNAKYVESVNREGNRTYRLGLNQFADLTDEEFKASFLGYKPNPSVQKEAKVEKNFTYANLADVPAYMDWRTYGAVTGVKNQASCGSCWAFSAVAAMEGIVKIKKGQLLSLSEQEILDCIGNGMSCKGGNMEAAFSFVIRNGGLTTENNYPYTGSQGTCDSTKKSASAATISNYQKVAQSEAALLNAVANQPVSVAIEGSGRDFKMYKSGVFPGPCGTNLDHAVTAIGYGESDGTKYWLVKNSWGTGWGEDGFMRMQRDTGMQGGLCGLTQDASYPIA